MRDGGGDHGYNAVLKRLVQPGEGGNVMPGPDIILSESLGAIVKPGPLHIVDEVWHASSFT